jgi:antitoxin (DNA-binding transcriptional repressor) of toxin-antitoxin stability system
MQRISLQDAQTELQQLVDAAVRGETVLIVSDDEQVVQLVPLTTRKRRQKPGQPADRMGQYVVVVPEQRTRKAGSAKGLIRIAPDFDAPLPDFDEYMG